jgi:histidine ammonia-lyase
MTVVLGEHPLTIEDVVRVARENAAIEIAGDARGRIAKGRTRLDELLARGDRIYGVNTGVGGNVGISLAPEQMELMQHNLVRHLSCATGTPLPNDVVRAATLLRVATFLPGTSAVRNELVDALVGLLNHGVTPVVPLMSASPSFGANRMGRNPAASSASTAARRRPWNSASPIPTSTRPM